MYEFLKGRLVAVRVPLLLATLVLVAIGIITIYSVGHPDRPDPLRLSEASRTEQFSNYWQKQVQYALVGILGFIAVNLINYRRLGAISYWLYSFVVLLLAVLLFDKFVDLPFVPVINGARRWIRFEIGNYTLPAFQPSEFCKLAYIIALSWYLRYRSNYRRITALLGPFALTVLPMALILMEPNLGTVVLMLPVLFTMLFVAGAKGKHLLLIILLAVVVSPLFWCFMRDYQKTRLNAVLFQYELVREKAQQYPALAKLLLGTEFSEKKWRSGWGHHLLRSKYAVASGGITGYGFRNGPFIRYNFLPYRHNDFIFAAIAHQWGFIGCVILFLIYATVFVCGLEIAGNNTDPFGKLLAVGIVAMFAVEVIVNASMTLGLLPITGLTLPLVSYGGSSLLVNMLAVGLLNNVGRCRPFTVAPKSFI